MSFKPKVLIIALPGILSQIKLHVCLLGCPLWMICHDHLLFKGSSVDETSLEEDSLLFQSCTAVYVSETLDFDSRKDVVLNLPSKNGRTWKIDFCFSLDVSMTLM